MLPPLAPLHHRSTLQLAADVHAMLSPESVLEPLNASTEPWVRSIVWTDFRVAVTLFVVAPLALLGWSVVSCRPPSLGGEKITNPPRTSEVALRLMTSYWQASSLLLITVLLNVQESQLGVATGLIAQAMIVLSLWWWTDLNDEIDGAEPTALISAFSSWRVLASFAATAGVVVQVPFQPCVFAPALVDDASCAAWLEPPKFAAQILDLTPSPELGLVAAGSCSLYFAVLAYYCAVLLPQVGRSGRAPRPRLMDVASPIGAWRMLGFIGAQADAEG